MLETSASSISKYVGETKPRSLAISDLRRESHARANTRLTWLSLKVKNTSISLFAATSQKTANEPSTVPQMARNPQSVAKSSVDKIARGTVLEQSVYLREIIMVAIGNGISNASWDADIRLLRDVKRFLSWIRLGQDGID